VAVAFYERTTLTVDIAERTRSVVLCVAANQVKWRWYVIVLYFIMSCYVACHVYVSLIT